jgi:predicted transcriptional regulator YdeE
MMLKIGDFSKITQVSIKTLRYYDKLGLLKPTWINRYTGHRFYQVGQIARLNRILVMKELGFTLEQIHQFLHENQSTEELRGLLKMKKAELEHQLQLEQERLQFIKNRLEQLDEAVDEPKNSEVLLHDLTDAHKEIIIMEPKIVAKDAFTIVGQKVVTKNQKGEIPQLWDQMGPRWQELTAVQNPEKFYGICGTMEDDGRFSYHVGQHVSQTDVLPADMESLTVAAQTYAVFRCTIPTIGETYEYAFNTWLPTSKYEAVPAPDFELYDEDFHPENSQTDPVYIYIPVKEK